MRFLWTRAERDPITVAIKNPMEEVVIEEVIPDLFLMQSLVDGYIKLFKIPTIKGVYGYENDRAKIRGKDPNFFVPEKGSSVFGTAVFFALDDRNNPASLEREQIEEIGDYLNMNNCESRERYMGWIRE